MRRSTVRSRPLQLVFPGQGQTRHLLFFLSLCHWRDSNPQSYDYGSSVLPLCSWVDQLYPYTLMVYIFWEPWQVLPPVGESTIPARKGSFNDLHHEGFFKSRSFGSVTPSGARAPSEGRRAGYRCWQLQLHLAKQWDSFTEAFMIK